MMHTETETVRARLGTGGVSFCRGTGAPLPVGGDVAILATLKPVRTSDVVAGLGVEVAGGPAADGALLHQLGGDQLDRPPVAVVGEQVLDLVQHPPFEPLDGPVPGPPGGQLADVAEVAAGLLPAVGPGVLR